MKKEQIFEDIQLNYTKIVLDVFRDKNVQKTINNFKKIKDAQTMYDVVWEMLNYEVEAEISKLHDVFLSEYPYHQHKVQKQWERFQESSIQRALVNETKERVKEEILFYFESKLKKTKRKNKK